MAASPPWRPERSSGPAGYWLRRTGCAATAHGSKRKPTSTPASPTSTWTGKAAALAMQAQRIDARRHTLNEALSWAAARWAVDQAIAAGAGVIYVEDLRSMEAGRMGRTINTQPP